MWLTYGVLMRFLFIFFVSLGMILLIGCSGEDQDAKKASDQIVDLEESQGTVLTNTAPELAEAQEVRLRFESQIPDVSSEDFEKQGIKILNDERGWIKAGFSFVADNESEYRIVLAEGSVVDDLCFPIKTFGTVSCQNGPTVAINADKYRNGPDHWTQPHEIYLGYLFNHEVGHLIGMRHYSSRCPTKGELAGVMEQQTAGLQGCVGNPWPRDWEIEYAKVRPVKFAPWPEWGPLPIPENLEASS